MKELHTLENILDRLALIQKDFEELIEDKDVQIERLKTTIYNLTK